MLSVSACGCTPVCLYLFPSHTALCFLPGQGHDPALQCSWCTATFQLLGNTIWLRPLCFLETIGGQRSWLTLCKCSCCRADLLVNEGQGSGAGGHRGWPSLCMRAPGCLPLLRPPSAERAFDCVRADNVWSSVATEGSPLGLLRCERWQAAGSKPIDLKEHLSDV